MPTNTSNNRFSCQRLHGIERGTPQASTPKISRINRRRYGVACLLSQR